MPVEERGGELPRARPIGDPAEQVVRLGGIDREPARGLEGSGEAAALLGQAIAGRAVIGLVLVRDLEEELAQGIDVPHGRQLADRGDQGAVARGEDPEPDAGHPVALGDALDDDEAGAAGEVGLLEEGETAFALGEVGEGLVHDHLLARREEPVHQALRLFLAQEVAARVVGVHEDEDVGLWPRRTASSSAR